MAATRMNKVNICKQCNCTFHPWPASPSAPFCSSECSGKSRRVRALFICEICARTFETKKSQADKYNVRFCSRACKGTWWKDQVSGDKAPWYKGGWINENGYRVISVNGRKYLEQRHVAEQHLGRRLTDKEAVHHVDGNKLNNVIENLQVMSYPEHMKLHWNTGHYAHRRSKE